MNHDEATRLMASEKYLLDELSPEESEAFEEHLFACHQCSMDVRAGSLFLEHCKVELAAPAADAAPDRKEDTGSGWFSWLKPAFAIPAFALLLLLVGYQNLIIYPALRTAVAQNRAPRILPAATLVRGVTRGAPAPAVIVRPGEPFLLPLEIPTESTFSAYAIELRGPSGAVVWSLKASSEDVKNTLTLQSPGVQEAGQYNIVVTGLDSQGNKLTEVGQYPIKLQFAEGGKS